MEKDESKITEELEKNSKKEDKKNNTSKKITLDKRCLKCNNLVSEEDKFCPICGADLTLKEKEKKEKKEINILPLITTFIILVICFALAFFIVRYIDFGKDNIDRSNKTVTIKDSGIADSVEKVYDSVVVVENYINKSLYATGSGFVYKTDNTYGYILTNNHVITNATEVKLGFTNDKKVTAKVVGVDEYADIAVLRVAKKYIIQVAELGDNSKMRIGDTTFAVGTPVDAKTYSWSVSRGILSGKDRVVESGSSYMKVLQTDTPINSGNSGGPLCNANGEVIGITNMKLASNQIEGMGFAIPIETATSYADQFINGKDVRRPYIGVAIYDGSNSFFSSERYVVIESVEKSSPAEKAGLKAGDVITKINDEEVQNSSYFKYKLYSHKIGDTVKITVDRNGKEKEFKVKLTSNSKEA